MAAAQMEFRAIKLQGESIALQEYAMKLSVDVGVV
jgi:hypothetical protein